jgi:hypothetical protein
MSEECTGRGECFVHCACECDDIFKEDDEVVCECIHSGHIGGYCPGECKWECKLKECRMCSSLKPEYFLQFREGLCGNCYFEFGPVKLMGISGECPICLELKQMVRIVCENHLFCLQCWKDFCGKGKGVACPICRKLIWKQKWIRDLKEAH